MQANGKCILLSEDECHIINNLLTELARALLGNIGPKKFPEDIQEDIKPKGAGHDNFKRQDNIYIHTLFYWLVLTGLFRVQVTVSNNIKRAVSR